MLTAYQTMLLVRSALDACMQMAYLIPAVKATPVFKLNVYQVLLEVILEVAIDPVAKSAPDGSPLALVARMWTTIFPEGLPDFLKFSLT